MGYVEKTINAESGGNPNSRNALSSAAGPGGFIDGTWLDMLAKHRPDITGSRDELLALKSDPKLSAEMTAAYGAENAGVLQKSGLAVTDGTQYLAHFAGPRGAVGLLNADPSTPAASILGQGFARANPTLAGYSAGQLAAWADRKMGGAGAPAQAAPMSIAGPAAAPGAPSAPAAPSQDQPQQTAQAPDASQGNDIFGGYRPSGGGQVNLAALTAVPQLQNLLPPRRPIGPFPTAPFSLRG